jgi:hypothetical protein
MASSKTNLWWGLAAGIVLMFLAVVFIGPVFQQTCCKSAKNLGNQTCDDSCNGGGGSGGGSGTWNGVCTREIIDECCDEPTFTVRMCAGQIVTDPRECYDLYCEIDGQKCTPFEQITTIGYKCGCSSIYDIPR